MSAIGHPILGDFFYSPLDVYQASTRLLLHAEELRIKHPITSVDMRFHSPCPFKISDFG